MEQVSFSCQVCRARLNLRGDFDSLSERAGDPHSAALQASVFDNARIDESFIVLDDKRAPSGGPSGRALDESFVVLGSASLLRPPPGLGPSAASQAPGARGGGGDGGNAAGGSGVVDARLQALAALFEVASSATSVDHPLCLDCAQRLKDEVTAQVAEAERETAAYAEAIARLEAEPSQALPQAEFEAQVAALQAETASCRTRTVSLAAALAAAQAEAEVLAGLSADVDALEERYWHDLNEYTLQLGSQLGERDALLNKIDRTNQRLALLKSTNVLNDAFRIWHDGPFGTISGFRLGRTPDTPVDWDEINAAWGQAVLLLHTMAQACKLNFSAYRLLPMGSHPRVADKRATYDLFGPVSKLWSTSYDRAMAVYLACLREFGDFAAARDAAEGKAPVFEFPFAIEGDKVGGYTVRLSVLSKDIKWTKALKLMLADLKVALQWMIRRDRQATCAAAPRGGGGGGAQGRPPPLAPLSQEGPATSAGAGAGPAVWSG